MKKPYLFLRLLNGNVSRHAFRCSAVACFRMLDSVLSVQSSQFYQLASYQGCDGGRHDRDPLNTYHKFKELNNDAILNK